MDARFPRPSGWLRREFSPTLQYLYFMRFSLLLWLFPVVFAGLDLRVTESLSRGIWVPERWQGFACMAFFLLASGCVALITARTVAINGVERFAPKMPPCVNKLLETDAKCAEENQRSSGPPDWMRSLLVNDRAMGEWRAVLLAVAPAFAAMGYAAFCAWFEEVRPSAMGWGFLVGFLMALAFWYVVNACYYLAYERPVIPAAGELLVIGKNAARTILLPRRCFGLKLPGDGVLADGPPHTLEDVTTSLRSGFIARWLSQFLDWIEARWGLPGYLYPQSHRVYEAQLFVTIAASGFLFLFAVLYPLTAPGWTVGAPIAIAALVVALLWIAATVGSGRFPVPTSENRRLLWWWKLRIIGSAVFFCVTLVLLWWLSDPDRFPTLASILLLLILLGWMLGAVAFALDRFRVPVLIFVLIAAILPRMLHVYEWFGAFEEHYLSTATLAADAPPLPTPAEIMAGRLGAIGAGQPLVVVTATGGGLHASAWTTQVLRQLYLDLAEHLPDSSGNPDYKLAAETMRKHLLLLSTVSGGSVGLRYYLEALHDGPGQERFDQMVVAAQCSSLEAVSWGLTYFDFTRASLPGLPFLWWPSPGSEDPAKGPLGKDRTWALRRGIERNWADRYCWAPAATRNLDPRIQMERPTLSHGPWRATQAPLTIGTLQAPDYPAFTMNTTTVEMGDRFLLANYRLPKYELGAIEGPPAESFLDSFPGGDKPDLPLSTAAQLSATFPYVSSAARIPARDTEPLASAHFVDGGYYDNDGTSSAIEFLRYALDPPPAPSQSSPAVRDIEQANEFHTKIKLPVKILLIEIRNSEDSDVPGFPSTPSALNPPKQPNRKTARPSGVLQQLEFPPQGLWSAGHGSVTGRNRNGLDLLVQSHPQSLQLRQIVFDDHTQPGQCLGLQAAQDPLSWSLTPRQREEVTQNADRSGWLKECYEDVVGLLSGAGKWQDLQSPKRCKPHEVAEVTCGNRRGVQR